MAIDPLDALEKPAGIPVILRAGFVLQARAGTRTHIFVPAKWAPGARTALSAEGKSTRARKGAPVATRFAGMAPGDRLWVQEETGTLIDRRGQNSRAYYLADLKGGHVPIPGNARGTRYKTQKHDAKALKREDSRYTLEVTHVRECRAWEITFDDMRPEGTLLGAEGRRAWWDRWYGLLLPWDDNPEVIGITFRFCDGNIDTGERWIPPAEARPPNLLLARMKAPAPGCPYAGCIHPPECKDLERCKYDGKTYWQLHPEAGKGG